MESEEEIANVARAQHSRELLHQCESDAVRYANVKAARQAIQYDEGLNMMSSTTTSDAYDWHVRAATTVEKIADVTEIDHDNRGRGERHIPSKRQAWWVQGGRV